MLKPYRRHQKSCPHRSMTYRRCTCPIWVVGTVDGVRVRKSLDTRNWKHAEDKVLGMLTEETPGQAPGAMPVTVKAACEAYLTDCNERNLKPESLRKMTRCINRLSAELGTRPLRSVTVADVRAFRGTLKFSPITVAKHVEMIRAFFGFCIASGWLTVNPAKAVKSPKVPPNPTLPFSDEEMEKIFWAVDSLGERRPHVSLMTQKKMKALVLLMRHTGLRISDAVSLTRDRVKGGKLFLYQAKTMTPVWIPVQKAVLKALTQADAGDPRYFSSGNCTPKTATTIWQMRFKNLFQDAGVEHGHAHRFRDTFACSLLLAGVPVTEVSILLGHANTAVTERHYAPWVRARQERLEELVRRTWV